MTDRLIVFSLQHTQLEVSFNQDTCKAKHIINKGVTALPQNQRYIGFYLLYFPACKEKLAMFLQMDIDRPTYTVINEQVIFPFQPNKH